MHCAEVEDVHKLKEARGSLKEADRNLNCLLYWA